MKAKIIATGEIFEAKFVKDMTEDERNESGISGSYPNSIALEPSSWEVENGVWRFMWEEEVEIISEVSE